MVAKKRARINDPILRMLGQITHELSQHTLEEVRYLVFCHRNKVVQEERQRLADVEARKVAYRQSQKTKKALQADAPTLPPDNEKKEGEV